MPMDARLQELLDKQAIHEVMQRYCRTMDWLDEAGHASCYWPDAEIDFGFFKGRADAFVPMVMAHEREAVSIARETLAIEALFGHPVDVEWVLEGDGDRTTLSIVQARPITGVSPVETLTRWDATRYAMTYGLRGQR